ncbi:MAG: ribosome biogenesis GTPase YlqF [Thermosynechococcaceae cyanobacterium MS004]|nr:ribosome biogenesis GTPase YlqF [Thermosynechococcaceae cyanobacterium MS004]
MKTSTPPIQWYPGHIAKAEKALITQLKRVDVVLEVRDARIPLASAHPQASAWVGEKPRILILNRMDLVSAKAIEIWQCWFAAQGEVPYFTDAQHGKGISAIAKAAQATGQALNQRRRDRGMNPRAVRAVVIGFPNVGKSALINRLLNRRVVESARKPGVTRQLRWVRISPDLDLLDAPGVLPPLLKDQDAAYRLAMCDDIGEGAYDRQLVASALIQRIQEMEKYCETLGAWMPQNSLQSRYGLDLGDRMADEYLAALAEVKFKGDVDRMAHHVLNDFRKGILGAIPLEVPPVLA